MGRAFCIIYKNGKWQICKICVDNWLVFYKLNLWHLHAMFVTVKVFNVAVLAFGWPAIILSLILMAVCSLITYGICVANLILSFYLLFNYLVFRQASSSSFIGIVVSVKASYTRRAMCIINRRGFQPGSVYKAYVCWQLCNLFTLISK